MSNADKLKSQIKQQFLDSINKVTEDISNIKVDNHVIPESIFVDSFLPYFAGAVLSVEGRNIVTEWVSVAGTPMNEVDVIDDAGKVLFSVPPLFNTSVLNVANTKASEALSNMTTQYDLLKASTPIYANNFINNALAKHEASMLSNPESENLKEYKERWDSIMKRYNVPTTKEVEVEKFDPADDVIYD